MKLVYCLAVLLSMVSSAWLMEQEPRADIAGAITTCLHKPIAECITALLGENGVLSGIVGREVVDRQSVTSILQHCLENSILNCVAHIVDTVIAGRSTASELEVRQVVSNVLQHCLGSSILQCIAHIVDTVLGNNTPKPLIAVRADIAGAITTCLHKPIAECITALLGENGVLSGIVGREVETVRVDVANIITSCLHKPISECINALFGENGVLGKKRQGIMNLLCLALPSLCSGGRNAVEVRQSVSSIVQHCLNNSILNCIAHVVDTVLGNNKPSALSTEIAVRADIANIITTCLHKPITECLGALLGEGGVLGGF